MSYVDMKGFVRWTDPDHTSRSEAYVRARISHAREHILMRRLFAFVFYVIVQMLPEGNPLKALLTPFVRPLPQEALAEMGAAAQVYDGAEALANAGRADAARLHAALDYEDAQVALSALPDGDTNRPWFQAVVDAVTPETLALVAERAAFWASAAPAEGA